MSMAGVTIVDYGMGNLRSVQKAFERVGCPAEITSDPVRVAAAGRLVVPGVGAFRDAIGTLRDTRLAGAICNHACSDRPFLGICLGMQLLFGDSFEDGHHTGLNLFAGSVVRFPCLPGLKVPHMGWNDLNMTRPDCPLFAGLPPSPAVYFVHSYYPVPAPGLERIVAATAEYPNPFPAVIWDKTTFATQFHPEKSQAVGLRMLANFAAL